MEFIELCKPFNSLSNTELYHLLKLRSEIFVVEQQCIYLDQDNKDLVCEHLMLLKNKEIVAYARIVPAGVSYDEPSIGRIVTSKNYRNLGYGRALVKLAIENCLRLHGNHPIQIGAQLYLKEFYESFGFIAVDEVYDEDGIDHIHMIRA